MQRNDYLMLAVIITIFGFYSLYWFSGGPDFGARYWYLMIVPCVALTVRGLQFVETTLESGAVGFTGKKTQIVVAVLSLCMLTLVNYLPWRAIDKYYHYRGMRPDIRSLAKEYDFGRSLVLIRGEQYPDYASAAAYNPIDLHADVPVYASDRNDEARTHVLKAYADRPVWIVNGPSITQNGFEVVDGPLSMHELTVNENNLRY